MIETIRKRKEVLVQEALSTQYAANTFEQTEVTQIKKVVETLSDVFDKQYEKYKDLVKQEETLINDIDDSGTFSPEMDNPDDPFNDQMQLVERKFENERNQRQKVHELNKYLNQIDIPYFGSLSEGDVRRYVGKNILLDSDFKVLVSDWRSPLGSKYYQYRYTNNGTVKKIYSIRSGKLEEIFEVKSGNKEADIFLLKELSNKKGGSLSDIVNTIQSQQDEIIRSADDKPMVIQGVAGSGKTTILFHRISYLMFNNSEKYSREKILLIVPTKIFKTYTEDIKVSLGIGDINVMTYSEFIKQYLKLQFPFVTTEIESNKTKNIVEIFKENELEIVKKKLEAVGKFGIGMFEEYVKLSKNRKLTFLEKVEIISEILELEDIAIEKLKENLSTLEVFLELSDNNELKKNIGDYNKYLQSQNKELTSKRGVTKVLSKPLVRFTLNEINQLVELKMYLEGNEGFKYNLIAVDEAQNLNLQSISIISKFVKNSNVIFAGDIAQRISNDGISDWKDLKKILDFNYFEMDTTYRISKEIVEYLKSEGFKKENLPKAVISKPGTLNVYDELDTNEFKKKINELDEKSDNLAIICNGVELKEKVLKLFESSEITDKLGISIFIIDILQSKGLEFESVITVGFTKPDNFKYIASTRTLNNLIDIKSLSFK
jgi:DNA helicase IV